MRICIEEGCNLPFRTRDYCTNHYLKARYKGKITNLSKTQCLANDCPNITRSKHGFCTDHYNLHVWNVGKAAKEEWFAAQPEENMSAAVIRACVEDGTAHTRLTAQIKPQNECLVWTGGRTTHGRYGLVGLRIRTGKGNRHFTHPVLAHRLAYALKHPLPASQLGPKSDTLTINHKCRNSLCVNVEHLEVLTQLENIKYKTTA